MPHLSRIEATSGLSKQAGTATLVGRGIRHLWDKGVWSGVANLSSRGVSRLGVVGATARAIAPTAGFLARPSVRLGSIALLPASMLGVPGAQAASNILAPGWAAAFAAPNAITSARLASGSHTEAIKADAMRGSQTAISDFLTVAQQSPQSFSQPGQYKELLGQFGINTDNIGRYNSGQNVSQPSAWKTLGDALSDPKGAVNSYVRNQLQQHVKQAGLGSLTRMGGKALPFAMAAPMAYGVGKSLLETKPYNALAAEQEGYDATQAKISAKVDDMGAVERLALRMDPTLAFGKAESTAPGAIKNWEQASGQTYKPGWLESLRKNWSTGGTPNFYTYDGNNNRSYLPTA